MDDNQQVEVDGNTAQNDQQAVEVDDNDAQHDPLTQEQRIPEKVKNSKGLTWSKVVCFAFAVLLYYVDIVSDCWVAYRYIVGENIHVWNQDVKIALTIIFILFPMFHGCLRTLPCCFDDKLFEFLRRHTTSAFVRFAFLANGLFPPIRPLWSFVLYLIDGVRFNRAKKRGNEIEMARLYKEMRIALEIHASLRWIEAFFEAAPQLILQTFIIAEDWNKLDIVRLISMTISMLTLACTLPIMPLPAFLNQVHGATATQQEGTMWLSSMIRTLGHVCEIGSRLTVVLQLLYPLNTPFFLPSPKVFYLLLFWFVRFVIAFYLMPWKASTNFRKKFTSFIRISFVLVISFVVFVESQSYFRYATYWTACFLENCLVLTVWLQLLNGDRHPASTDICMLSIGLHVTSGLLLMFYFKRGKWLDEKVATC